MNALYALLAVLLLLLLPGAVRRVLAPRFDRSDSDVSITLQLGQDASQLFVMVPGLRGADTDRKLWERLAQELGQEGDVALVDYAAHVFSNGDALTIAQRVNDQVQKIWEARQYPRVVLVGNSMGALIARKAFLYSQGAADDNPRTATAWSNKLARLVLLAGMSRGWDLSGEKPADMRWYVHVACIAALWFGRLTYTGRLLMQMESGEAFVANLRLEWMRWSRSRRGRKLETVQLLGDIDEVISAGDNADLRVSGQGRKFVWLKVRGTGHASILDTTETREELGKYRLNKFRAAIKLSFDELQWRSEELPYTTDDKVRHVVFVLHGIRDLGEWSSRIETGLQEPMLALPASDRRKRKLAIASVRYGYFGMSQFLLPLVRRKFVRWFMDTYTETLARYPNVRRVDFIGHSHGTYLLGEALRKYRSMKVGRVVLGGSVLPQDYDWKMVFEREQVQVVRNYVADDDWVVALFPRLFELYPMHWLNRDLGSAGFNGFHAGKDGPGRQPVENIKLIQGGHGAFLGELAAIVDFLLAPRGAKVSVPTPNTKMPKRYWLKLVTWFSKRAPWAVWLAIIGILYLIGVGIAWMAGPYSTFALIVYGFVLLQLLRWA